MKIFLLLAFLAVAAPASYAAVKSTSDGYILIYPSSILETDLSGRCVRVENTSDVAVYLAVSTPDVLADALNVSKKHLKVSECAAR